MKIKEGSLPSDQSGARPQTTLAAGIQRPESPGT